MSPRFSVFAPAAAAALSVALAGCSSSGGTGNVAPKAGPITFTGSTIVNNVMTYPCGTTQTFTLSQSGFSGTFQVTDSDTDTITLTPSSGTASTTFSFSTNYLPPTLTDAYTVTATGANGTTGTLTVNETDGDCT